MKTLFPPPHPPSFDLDLHYKLHELISVAVCVDIITTIARELIMRLEYTRMLLGMGKVTTGWGWAK